MSRSQILDSPKQCPNYLCFKFIYLCILRRLQNFAKYPQVICPIYCQSDNWWRFRKILWPFQNVWTLHRVIGSLDVRSLCVKVYRLSHLLLPQEFHLFYSIQVFYNSYEIMCFFWQISIVESFTFWNEEDILLRGFILRVISLFYFCILHQSIAIFKDWWDHIVINVLSLPLMSKQIQWYKPMHFLFLMATYFPCFPRILIPSNLGPRFPIRCQKWKQYIYQESES